MNSTLLLSAALATGLLSACGSDKATTETTAASAPADSTKRADGPARASSPATTSTAATGSLTSAMAKMMQQMNANKPIGNTDHDFSHLMIAHHRHVGNRAARR